MAQKEQVTNENPYLGYTETATHTMKEMWNWQMKATQTMMNQAILAAQTWTDFAQTQVQESARLSQEMMKMGMQNSEEAKKSFAHLSEKILSTHK